MQMPWIILGDFNNVLHITDRIGGAAVTLTEVKKFQECIRACKLEEMERRGQNYTWNDKGTTNSLFKNRLVIQQWSMGG